jgi:hypothetical protein
MPKINLANQIVIRSFTVYKNPKNRSGKVTNK